MTESAEAAITLGSVGDSPLRSTHHEVSDELSDNHHVPRADSPGLSWMRLPVDTAAGRRSPQRLHCFTPKSTTGSEINHASGGPHSGMAPRLGVRVAGHLRARVSRPIGAEGVADQARGSRSFSRRVLHLDPRAWPTSGRARRRDGIPASTPPFIRAEQTTVVLSACCNEGSTAVNCGTPRCRPSARQRASSGGVDRFPSSRPKHRRLRRASAPGWFLRAEARMAWVSRAWVSRHAGSEDLAGRGQESRSFIACGAPP
jgi:hypothetical protein